MLGLTQSSFDPASRVRFIQFMPHLARAGWRIEFRPNSPDRQWRSPLRNRPLRGVHYRAGRMVMRANRLRDTQRASQFDVVFVNRDLAGGGLYLERRLLRRNPRVVFDFDDAIFLGPKNEPVVRWLCENAAWVTPGNAYLAEWAHQFTDRVTIVPTVVDTDQHEPRAWDDAPAPSPVRVGWTGSDSSIRATLFPHLEMFRELQREIDFELVVISNSEPKLPLSGIRWSFHPWSPRSEGRLAEMFDIGIMPLVDDLFQRGKCGLKLLQCMAAGLPTIASPVGVNAEIIEEGVTGFSASSDAEWRVALHALVGSPELCASMGRAGRQRCEANYSVRSWLPVLSGIFSQVGGTR